MAAFNPIFSLNISGGEGVEGMRGHIDISILVSNVSGTKSTTLQRGGEEAIVTWFLRNRSFASRCEP